MTDIISLGAENGSYQMHPAKHSVVLVDNTYHGEIRVGVTFTAGQVQEQTPGHEFLAFVLTGLVLNKIPATLMADFRLMTPRKTDRSSGVGGTASVSRIEDALYF